MLLKVVHFLLLLSPLLTLLQKILIVLLSSEVKTFIRHFIEIDRSLELHDHSVVMLLLSTDKPDLILKELVLSFELLDLKIDVTLPIFFSFESFPLICRQSVVWEFLGSDKVTITAALTEAGRCLKGTFISKVRGNTYLLISSNLDA